MTKKYVQKHCLDENNRKTTAVDQKTSARSASES